MQRFSVLLVVTVMAFVMFVPVGQATHEWGHRYMIFGRILDSNGDPAQQVPLSISVETTMPSDPQLPTTTDCMGLYYSYNPELSPQEMSQRGMEAGVMHIHVANLPSDAKYTITSEFGEKKGSTRSDMHRNMANFDLDADVPAKDTCNDAPDWRRQYVVQGRAQRDLGNEREDLMTVEQAGLKNTIEVLLETTNGTRNLTVDTNQFGDYFAVFEDVEVEEGAKITARWKDEERTTTVGSSGMKYHVSEVNIIVKDAFGGTALKVFLYILGGIAVIGAIAFGVSKAREGMETKRLRETSGRKRANR